MKIVGIAGGVASGKSLVSSQLETLGAANLNADGIGHEVLREPKIKDLVRDYWGPSVFDANGEIDRKQLAKRVFAAPPSGPRDLAQLEKITHPRISQRIEDRIKELGTQGLAAAIVDAAVMFKAGWDQYCDLILFVNVARQQRLERAMTRGWTEQEFDAREASQETLDYKRSRSDFEIDNNGSVEQTAQQVNQIWNEHIAN